MSTYVSLVCLDHSPQLVAEDESGQHLYDLPQIFKDIADRAELVARAADDDWPGDYFRRNTVRFLCDHPTCQIGVIDEYGIKHFIEEIARIARGDS